MYIVTVIIWIANKHILQILTFVFRSTYVSIIPVVVYNTVLLFVIHFIVLHLFITISFIHMCYEISYEKLT
jgi:hypothetical protein